MPLKDIQPFKTWLGMFRRVLKAAYSTAFTNRKRAALLGGSILTLLLIFYAGVARAPSAFPDGRVVTIPKGVTLTEASALLEENGIVRSAFWFQILATLHAGEGGVIAGEYRFEKRPTIFTVARNVTAGRFGFTPVRVRIPEGATVREMATLYDELLPLFDSDEFVRDARDLEGFLFPDTYLFPPTATNDDVLAKMQEVFKERTSDIGGILNDFGRPLEEIVTMASILEKEANDLETKRRIAGILWRRLDIGMPLQVDAAFLYFLGKNTYELTTEDLAADSPYNTYRYKGLPPGPIANPSIESIQAAATPIASEYLYYLADRRGTTYYSRTFDEHKEKKALYIN